MRVRKGRGWRPWSTAARRLVWTTCLAAVVAPGAANAARGGSIYLERPTRDTEVMRALTLEAGESTFVRTAFPVRRVSVGNPDVVDLVVLSPTEVQIVAQEPGSTNAVVWSDRSLPVAVIEIVVGRPLSGLAAQIRHVLGYSGVEAHGAGEAIILSGHVPSSAAVEHVLRLAEAFAGKKAKQSTIINMLEVGGNHQVMLEVVIAEMQRSMDRRMGTNFNAMFRDGDRVFEFTSLLDGLVSSDTRDRSLDITDFELTSFETMLDISQNVNVIGAGFGVGRGFYEIFLSILQDKQVLKILAEPTLVARSGETARFLAGGEVAIPIVQGGAFGSISVEFKEFGVGLAFTPTVLEPERIHLEVIGEVSEPDFTLGIGIGGFLVPGFVTRRAGTSVEMKDGQTFAIAGLLRDEVRESVKQYPLLGEIPILGALFRSSQYQRDETELVVLITPRFVKPLRPGPHPLPTDFFVAPSDFEFYLLGAVEGRSVPPAVPPASVSAGGGARGGLIGAVGHRVRAEPEDLR